MNEDLFWVTETILTSILKLILNLDHKELRMNEFRAHFRYSTHVARAKGEELRVKSCIKVIFVKVIFANRLISNDSWEKSSLLKFVNLKFNFRMSGFAVEILTGFWRYLNDYWNTEWEIRVNGSSVSEITITNTADDKLHQFVTLI